MKTFEQFFLEMARPNRVIPALIGQEPTARYENLFERLGKSLRSGNSTTGEPLMDTTGDPAYGLGDDRIQERKLKWFFYVLTLPKLTGSVVIPHNLKPEIERSRKYVRNIISTNDIKNIPPTHKGRHILAIALAIKANPSYFNDELFEKTLFNPTALGDYLNQMRTTDNPTSQTRGKEKEAQHNIPLRNIDKVNSANRPYETTLNKMKGHHSIMKPTHNEV